MLLSFLVGGQVTFASARVVQHGGRLFGVATQPRTGSAVFDAGFLRATAPRAPAVSYHGGPVLHSSRPYLVFWGAARAFSPAYRRLLTRYLTDVARTSGARNTLQAVDHQYTDATGSADERQSFAAGQAIADTQPYPAGGCAPTTARVAACLTDTQVESELLRLTAAENLPVGIGSGAPIYIVLLPQSVDECVTSGECASTAFCGYHTYVDAGRQPLLYDVLPAIALARGQNPKNCQWDGYGVIQEPNRSSGDVMLSTLSHEESETITDPLLDAWYVSGSRDEIADRCTSAGAFDPSAGNNPRAFLPLLGGSVSAGTAFDQTLAGDHYYVQSVWSDRSGGCAMRPASAAGPARARPSRG